MFDSYTTTTLKYVDALCINCEMCINVCPHGVFEPGAEAVVLAHPADCMECGACMVNCPTRAIKVNSGVGCAAAMISAALTGKPESCGGDDGSSACACGSSGKAETSDCGCTSEKSTDEGSSDCGCSGEPEKEKSDCGCGSSTGCC